MTTPHRVARSARLQHLRPLVILLACCITMIGFLPQVQAMSAIKPGSPGTISDLGVLPQGQISVARAINNRGEVVGTSDGETGVGIYEDLPFLWSARDGMRKLDTLDGQECMLYDINERGMIIGGCRTSSDAWHATVWIDGRATDLSSLLGSSSTVWALNNRGEIAGASRTATDETHAFVWTKQDGKRDLGTLPGGDWSSALSINNRGDIVGIARTADGSYHAVLWPAGGAIQDLGTLGGERSEATDINDRGQVVGFSYIPGGYETHAFVWTQQDGMRDLGTLSGGSMSMAEAINNRGEIVGVSTSADGQSLAVLWTAQEGIRDLGTLPGGSASGATEINDRGQIVGYSYLPVTPPISYGYHAVLWTVTGAGR